MEVQTNLDDLMVFANRGQCMNSLSDLEVVQINLLIQMLHDDIQHRMQGPNGWNP